MILSIFIMIKEIIGFDDDKKIIRTDDDIKAIRIYDDDKKKLLV
jgi:hypothetical protein